LTRPAPPAGARLSALSPSAIVRLGGRGAAVLKLFRLIGVPRIAGQPVETE
jgi:hypothetical protein